MCIFRIYVVSLDVSEGCGMAVAGFSVNAGVCVETVGDGVLFNVFAGFDVLKEHEDNNTAADNNSMISFVFVFKACMIEISS